MTSGLPLPARPGKPFPLGATWDGRGVNFSLFSENATAVELCLFDADGEIRVPLLRQTAFVWHVYIPGLGPGTRYGYRVHGPYDPINGHRFNAAKLLVDPYAKAIDGTVDPDIASPFAYVRSDHEDADLWADETDNGDAIPKCVVIDSTFDWEGDQRPEVPWQDTIIYELHVRGFTKQHPEIAPELRGTYAGLASEPAISYLKDLGITAVELLPVHHIADEWFLHERDLVNYWGYSTLGFLAPHSGYSASGTTGEQVNEFKGMVKALHRAGIEVILDVVYNHTCEGDHHGPSLSLRGIDNQSYYRLDPDDPRRYIDFTGTGNSLNVRHPSALRLIMDSLRYFVLDCHVDGFRFDLASALAREFYDVDRLSSFFDIIHQDPVLSGVKLIAEPWDVGPGGYQVGQFPVLWTEWNGIYRDVIRDAWRGRTDLSQFAKRLSGSADLYGHGGRSPYASINFVTCHDGFTLTDLVSYEQKHNEANQQDNEDGTNDNRSWNCGVEGPTDDPEIKTLRARQKRNFLTTVLLSQGVPMVLAGDEINRTQHGNNNPWCQDNEISWTDWNLDAEAREMHAFTRRLIRLWRSHPVLRRDDFLKGEGDMNGGLPDSCWLRPDGNHMEPDDWHSELRTFGLFLNGSDLDRLDDNGVPVTDDSFILMFNLADHDVDFTLPRSDFGEEWSVELSTADVTIEAGQHRVRAEASLALLDRSIVVLRHL